MWYRLQPREKIMLALLGLVCLFFVLFKFLLIPQFSKHGENKDKLADLQSQVQVAEAVVRSQKRETELAAQAARQLNELKPLFNNVMGDGLAIVHIGLKAVETNVQIVSFAPSDIVDRGIYLELPAHFEVRGDYRDVSNFISKIEELPDLSELRKLEIKPNEAIMPAQPGSPATAADPNFPQAPLVEMVPTQDGTVVAAFDIITFTSTSPEARLQIEQTLSWAVGRYNAFLSPGPVSPYPGIKSVVKNLNPFLAPLAISDQMFNNLQETEGVNNTSSEQVSDGKEVSNNGQDREGSENKDVNSAGTAGAAGETAAETKTGGSTGSEETGSKIALQAYSTSGLRP
ncbi:MAG: Pilus assembly protein, PilO [Pelotomaculum sp. PtaB.Bin104]|nr:MAG: Pilus assembly protein, PilO [Pelotomaculum sp. PtaB.Bin104]